MKAESYLSRGVSPTKDEVKSAVAGQSKGLFPGAFCKLIEDVAGDPDWCMAIHADGAGTKSSAAYIMYRETGDPAWFGGIAQDSLVMNTDDLLCVGAIDGFKVSNTIGRNAHRVDGACLREIITGYDRIISKLGALGISVTMTGGETADVGDLVRTVICDSTVLVRLPRSQVIDSARIKAGQVIIGLASFGRTTYEETENSGMGSNGLTAARHLLLHPDYRTRYPESCSDTLAPDKAYCGAWHLADRLPGSSLTVGEAILSPTRTYLPVIREILPVVGDRISAIIHCTGGGQAKCRDFGQGIRYVKDNLFEAPPIFLAIAESSEIQAAELYQIFNMGHRLELICDESAAEAILDISARFGLPARKIGYTEAAAAGRPSEAIIRAGGREYRYS
jgi:phosphoribosylformylglycinamidine cyclo-ligase